MHTLLSFYAFVLFSILIFLLCLIIFFPIICTYLSISTSLLFLPINILDKVIWYLDIPRVQHQIWASSFEVYRINHIVQRLVTIRLYSNDQAMNIKANRQRLFSYSFLSPILSSASPLNWVVDRWFKNFIYEYDFFVYKYLT